ncbi:acyl-CoA dehydrogenase family protein [Peribacillus frigoritolerans]|uniref:acyl-CoA dehydrogenase family protein n=1 Tax=Peribacillus frigoritolerans TaxID=450367 RepID=UPI0021D03829|nr:acyl-CoA dehydrogenase family protein [Peribacillus frigoritolerans]MCU6598949.1 acyl-CoA dehydrogenase family protein [Peribacillus frigoritolerans]
MGHKGFLYTQLDGKYGGSNTDFSYSVIIIEELARVVTGIGIPMHSDIVIPYL